MFTTKENLPAFEILRVEWTQQFQQGEKDLYRHFLLQPSESSFESMLWISDNLPLYFTKWGQFILVLKASGASQL